MKVSGMWCQRLCTGVFGTHLSIRTKMHGLTKGTCRMFVESYFLSSNPSSKAMVTLVWVGNKESHCALHFAMKLALLIS
jgi:hypothetical protein